MGIDPQNKQRTSRSYRWLAEERINGKRIYGGSYCHEYC
jgi:hypothetical protein